MTKFKLRIQDLVLVGILISLILGVLTFLDMVENYTNQLLINSGFVILVIGLIYSYSNKKQYFNNLVLVYTSFSMMNIIYAYLYMPDLLMIPNFIICFLIFVKSAFYPYFFKRRKLKSVNKSKKIKRQIRDSEPKVDAKIVVEDFKTGKQSDFDTELKKKKTTTKKKKTTKKKSTKK